MRASRQQLIPTRKTVPGDEASIRLWLAVAAAVLSVATIFNRGDVANAVTIDWVKVGDPGNAGETQDYLVGGTLTFGAVAEEFRIGKYPVTIQQYTDFLNAVAATDTYSLYNENMATNGNAAGISRAGSSGAYTYSVIGSSGNKPITYVSWFDAARFANWMHNGQGFGDTEIGAYTLVGGQTSGTAPAKNPEAQFYIPTEDQWYKAAYYSPEKDGVGSPGYYTYATQSDTAPGNLVGNAANQANYMTPARVYAVTQSSTYSASQNYLTDVGAFSNSASFYGTFDQVGNVSEWNDLDGTADSSRGRRGGGWNDQTEYSISSLNRTLAATTYEVSVHGFRLASPAAVPEPSTWAMGLAGIACGGLGMWRRKRRS